MGLIAPPTYIAPPAIEGHRFGLYSAANMPEPSGRWELGVEWEPLAQEAAGLRPSECVGDYPGWEIDPPDVETSKGIPFVVVGSYACKSASRSMDEAEERARLHLAGGEERAVEYAVATGAMGNAPSFSGATDLTPTPGTAIDLIEAFRLIESELAVASHSFGTIHLPRALGAIADYDGIIARQGQHIETLIGTYVVFGGGYDLANVGPTGVEPDAGEYWIYGTGRPTVRRGEIFMQPDAAHYINKDDNDVVILAQRTILVSWSGPTVAVLVKPNGD